MIAFIIKSSMSLIILFGLYWFLLRKEKLFVFNRFFLVLSLVFSLVVPFISIPVNFKSGPELEKFIHPYIYAIPEVSSSVKIIPGDKSISHPFVGKKPPIINISAILLVLYFAGVIIFLIRFLRNINIIVNRSKLSEKISYEGYWIVLNDDKAGPCCFFRSIFLNREDYLNGRIGKELLDHELEHVKQSHTIDIVLIELVKIFYWFNPVHILYDRAIRINHEYLADNGVIGNKSDIKNYSDKLLDFLTGGTSLPLTSGSYQSFTKMRLTMMMKSRSGRFKYIARIAMILCMWMALFMILSFKVSDKPVSITRTSGQEREFTQGVVRGIVLKEDGKPLEGAEITTTGTLYTSSWVTTGSDGRFVLKNVQADASLMIGCFGYKGQMRKTNPASEMVINMVKDPEYRETITEDEISISIDGPKVHFIGSDGSPARALIVIDGVISDKTGEAEIDFQKINSRKDLMESIKILKDKEATDKYREQGKNGVIEITTKKNTIMPVIQEVNFRNSDFKPGKTLIVIDGRILNFEENLKVNPLEIESFKVLNDKEATNKYGDNGKDGVVEIMLYENKTKTLLKKSPERTASDTSKYLTYLSVNNVSNEGELIDIPVSDLQYISVWTYYANDNIHKKDFRSVGIMTRDFFKVKGRIVGINMKPLSGVKVSTSENPEGVTSDKEGHFVIEDVRENVMLEFSLPGYRPYYLATTGAVFTLDLTIELVKELNSGIIDTSLIHRNSTLTDTILLSLPRSVSLNNTDNEVTYTAAGYIKKDIINKKVVLTGDAVVRSGKIEIRADSIVFDIKSNQLFAAGRKDKSGKILGKPIFKEDTEQFEADELTYNFGTSKVLVKNIKP
jgi:beta-lactamase regulating signal transducer with metallopeptidase domain